MILGLLDIFWLVKTGKIAVKLSTAEDVIAASTEGSIKMSEAKSFIIAFEKSSENLERFRNIIVDGISCCSEKIELYEISAMREMLIYY